MRLFSLQFLPPPLSPLQSCIWVYKSKLVRRPESQNEQDANSLLSLGLQLRGTACGDPSVCGCGPGHWSFLFGWCPLWSRQSRKQVLFWFWWLLSPLAVGPFRFLLAYIWVPCGHIFRGARLLSGIPHIDRRSQLYHVTGEHGTCSYLLRPPDVAHSQASLSAALVQMFTCPLKYREVLLGSLSLMPDSVSLTSENSGFCLSAVIPACPFLWLAVLSWRPCEPHCPVLTGHSCSPLLSLCVVADPPLLRLSLCISWSADFSEIIFCPDNDPPPLDQFYFFLISIIMSRYCHPQREHLGGMASCSSNV